MKIHYSYIEEGRKFTNVNKALPEVNVRVICACVSIVDWNIERVEWEGEGRINANGNWVRYANPGEKSNLGLQVTHWKAK